LDLVPLLVVIRKPGISIKQLAEELGVTDRHASKIAIALEKMGTVTKHRYGKNVLLHPNEDSEVTGTLVMLEELILQRGEFPIEDIVHPVNNLRLINVLAKSPRTVNQVITYLEISRPTFYRMLKGFGKDGCGLVDVRGKREKDYFLDRSHWLNRPLVSLARALFGEVKYPIEKMDFRKLHLTSLRPRVLLYLSSYIPFQDSFVVPSSITQHGLAIALWTTQPIVSKELKRLSIRGFVQEKRQHVKNEKRMYKTYHLSREGILEVERLKTILDETNVPIVDFEGVRGNRRMAEVQSLFSMRIRTVEVLNYLSLEDVLNCNQFQRVLGSRRESEFISILHRLPSIKYFFGREEERKKFKQWLASDDSRVFFMRGVAGMGKTTFLSKVIQENKQSVNIFFYSIKEWSTPRNIFSHIAHFLQQLKRVSVSPLIEHMGEFNVQESILILEDLFKDTKALMIFDDIQKADLRIQQFFRVLLKSDLVEDIKLVLAGRELTEYSDILDPLHTQMELPGLKKEPSEKLLTGRGIHPSQFDMIYDYTGGHPLALELVETKNGMPDMNLKMFIREEIVPKLSEPETEILRFVSIFRYPFSGDALLLGKGMDPRTDPLDILDLADFSLMSRGKKGKKQDKGKATKLVDRLVERSFLIHDGDSYYLHDIFRNFFYKRMDPAVRKRYHLLASDYYRKMDNDPARVESIYHLLSGGDLEKAVQELNKWGENLIKRGFSLELAELFQGLEREQVSPPTRLGMDYYLGEMHYMNGNWDEALSRYESSIDLCEELEREDLAARAKMKVARIHSMMGKQEEALEEYQAVIELARDNDQFLIESDAVKQVGSRHYFMGNLEKLKEFYKLASEIAERTDSRECLANAYFLNTFLTKLSGDYEKCEQLNKECLRIYEELGNQAQALMVINNLGDLYYTLERWKDALEMFESLREISESVGDLQHKGFGLVNTGDTLIKLKNYEEAEDRLKEALDLFVDLKERRLILGTQAIMANLYKAKEDLDNARVFYERSINGYIENNMLLDLPVFLFEYADMEEALGNLDRAKELFERSLDYAKRMDNRRWIDKASKRLKELS